MMTFRKYPSLAHAAEALRNKGFSEQFVLEDGRLRHDKSGLYYQPAEVAIVEYHRFMPRNRDRSQISIIFALETADGLQGLLSATYNAYERVELLEFMDRVKIKASHKGTRVMKPSQRR